MPPVAASPRVGLFVTCLVDLFRPSVGFAAIKLLERAGCQVTVPAGQTCCGQPAYNGGDRVNARAIARAVIAGFGDVDYVVAPSGSCAGMIREHYPALFDDEPAAFQQARHLAMRTYELTAFLVDIMGMTDAGVDFAGTVTYHDGCSGLRELGVKDQPRQLLRSVRGLRLEEAAGAETCCGFGGTFCVKYPEISTRMVADKVADLAATGAETVLAGDMGCLLNMAGRLTREGRPMAARHVAEVLAGMTADTPPIGHD